MSDNRYIQYISSLSILLHTISCIAHAPIPTPTISMSRQLSQAAKKVAQNNQQINQVTAQLTQMQNDITATNDRLKEIDKSISEINQETMDERITQHDEFESLNAELEQKYAQKTRQRRQLAKLYEDYRALILARDKSGKQMQDIIVALENKQKVISNTIESLSLQIKSTSAQSTEYTAQLKKTLEKAQEYQKAINILITSLQQLHDSYDQLDQAMQKITSIPDDEIQHKSKEQEKINKLNDAIAKQEKNADAQEKALYAAQSPYEKEQAAFDQIQKKQKKEVEVTK